MHCKKKIPTNELETNYYINISKRSVALDVSGSLSALCRPGVSGRWGQLRSGVVIRVTSDTVPVWAIVVTHPHTEFRTPGGPPPSPSDTWPW